MLKIKERNNITNFSTVNGNGPPTCDIIADSSSSSFNTQVQESEYEKKYSDATVLLESETEALSHQIAGHSRTGVLKHKLGYVLKPLQKEPLGSREVEFYRNVYSYSSQENDNNTKNKHLKCNLMLQKHIPNYYGVMKIHSIEEESGHSIWKHYLALADLVEGFSKPCVIDIKIGAQTWDPSATLKKILHEKSKYAGTKAPLGLSLTGMQFYNLGIQKTLKMEKELGKTLVESTFIAKIHEFLNGAYNPSIPKAISKKLLPRLEDISKYFQVQREFNFYSSSLLIGYDAERFQNNSELTVNEEDHEDEVNSWLRVWMIDFAHVFPMSEEASEPDANYVFGLENLIKIFKQFHQSSSETNSSDSE